MTNVRAPSCRDADWTISTIAARQYGVVSRGQLISAGVSRDQIARRVHRNRLRPLQRGVYLVGPLMVARAQPMSAVLCCGESAVVSHHSAAVLWEIVDPSAASKSVDITIPAGARRHRPGVNIHRTALQPDEMMRLDALPVTTAARTLFDLASRIAGRDLERLIAEALSRRVTSQAALATLMQRYEHRPAARRLSMFLDGDRQPALSRSAAEDAFLVLTGKAQLPRPEANVRVEGHEVDFYWRTERLVVEMDGFAYHGSRRSFERDRRRDAVLAAAGLRVMRVTWRQLEDEREALLVRLAQALARSGAH